MDTSLPGLNGPGFHWAFTYKGLPVQRFATLKGASTLDGFDQMEANSCLIGFKDWGELDQFLRCQSGHRRCVGVLWVGMKMERERFWGGGWWDLGGRRVKGIGF